MSSRFQIDAPESTRSAVKIEAIRAGIKPSPLAVIALDYVTGLMAAGKTPKEVLAAIDKFKKAKAKRDADAKRDAAE